MALLDDIKKELNYRLDKTSYDQKLNDLIASAKKDLQITGLDASVVVETDPLIKRAIILYCQWNDSNYKGESERIERAYQALKIHLTLSGDYAVE
jgi:hypothetical protein